MSTVPFSGCRLKIERAKELLEILVCEIGTWAQSVPIGIIKEPDEVGSTHSLYVEILKQPPFTRWALIAGDCMHNLRSSLDNLVYDMAIIETGVNPPTDAEKLQFPIVGEAGKFAGQEYRIKPLKPSTKEVIEKQQPYNHPHSDLPPILEMLNKLNNENKHRMLSVVAASPHSVSVEIENLSPTNIEAIHAIINGKTKIHSFTLDPPVPNLKYKAEAVVPICILHDPGPSKSPLKDLPTVLNLMIEEVERITKTLTALFEDTAEFPQRTDPRLENRSATFQIPTNSATMRMENS